MKYSDLIKDKINSITLIEMSFERSAAHIKVTGEGRQVFIHIMKLMLFPKHGAKRLWIKEIDNWLNEFQEITLKSKKKYIDHPTLKFWLIDEPDRKVDKLINTFKQKFKPLKPKVYKGMQVDIDDILNRVVIDITNQKFKSIIHYLRATK